MEESFKKIINYFGILPSVIYNLSVILILFFITGISDLYTSCTLLFKWNESIFYISPICLVKSVIFLFLSIKIDKSNEKCSVFMIFINYIMGWIISVVFLIGFSELYYEKHNEKICQKLQNFDLFFILLEAFQVLFITIFGFYIFYTLVKKRILSSRPVLNQENRMTCKENQIDLA